MEREQTRFDSPSWRSAACDLRGHARARGSTAVSASARGAVRAYVGDAAAGRQILYNLVSNAVKLTEEAG